MVSVFIVIAGDLFTIIEKRFIDKDRENLPGLADGMWFVFATATTIGYGDLSPKSLIGRIMTVPISLLGFVVIASISGVVASLMTIERMGTNVHGVQDLTGKLVAFKEGTAAEESVRRLGLLHGFRTTPVSNQTEAYSMVTKREVDALIHDAPALRYYESRKGAGKVTVVKDLLDIHYYGIFATSGSDLLEPINQAHHTLFEMGRLEDLIEIHGI